MFDDVMVVVQLQRLSINGFVEGPGVCSVFLGQHLLQDGVAVLHLLTQLTPLPPPGSLPSTSSLSPRHLLHRLPAGFRGAGSRFPAGRCELCWFGILSRRGVGTASGDGRCGGGGGVGFPLHAFLLLGTQTSMRTDRQRTKLQVMSGDVLP